MDDDVRPFPIQKDLYGNLLASSIPWWLAEVAYEHYTKRFGYEQSLERLAERGGFGRDELVKLIRREL